MKKDIMVEHWAHMLDEAFSDEIANSRKLPNDENEKFVLSDIISKDEFGNASDDEISELFTKIWPKYWEYIVDCGDDVVEVQGQQRDVDDWDVWEIRFTDIYGSPEDIEVEMFKYISSNFFDGKAHSLREIVDDAIDYLKTTVEVPLNTLKMHGKLKHKGYMKYGGRYPG